MSNKPQNSILDCTPDNINNWLIDHGHPAYRSKQITQWLFHRGVKTISDMTDLSNKLRDELSASFSLNELPIHSKQKDTCDNTEKFLFRLNDDEFVEAVLMPRYSSEVKTNPKTGKIKSCNLNDIEGYTVCLTTQVGCQFACRFCASGQAGFKRNMPPSEIISQILAFKRMGRDVSRVVFMGTGEPLHNLDSLRTAIEIITSKSGLAMSPRRITISTVGLVPEIYRMARERWKVKLAVSLNSADNNIRAKLMPIAKVYQLDQLRDAVQEYQRSNGRRISFEYMMLDGINDSDKDAQRLKKFCDGIKCHVNLIPFNPVLDSEFQPSSTKKIQDFKHCLRDGKFDVTVRYSRGRNIDAACGQLRLRHELAREASEV